MDLHPYSLIETNLEIWREEMRGDEATEEELGQCFRYLLYSEPMQLPSGRQVEVLFQWIDNVLPSPASNPGRILRRLKSGVSLADLEALITESGLSFESQNHQKPALDLWLEGECLRMCIDTAWSMIGRWKGLRANLVDEGLTENTRGYLEEAAEAFLYGQYKATIALCRAALEAALKDRIPGVQPGSDIELRELIDRAEADRILIGKYIRLANTVRVSGNRILHVRKGATQNDARRMLEHTGEIFEQLFRRRG